jgi:hypothetical protein
MVELVGEIRTGVNAYCDPLQEDKKFLIGYRGQVINFVLGNTKDLSVYIEALESYDRIT